MGKTTLQVSDAWVLSEPLSSGVVVREAASARMGRVGRPSAAHANARRCPLPYGRTGASPGPYTGPRGNFYASCLVRRGLGLS